MGIAAACAVAAATTTDKATPPGWSTLGGSPDRCSIAAGAPIMLASPMWTLSRDDLGQPIVFAPSASVIASQTQAFALGEINTQSVLFAVDLASGAIDWTAPIDPPFFDSWSSPSLDTGNNTVIIASDLSLTALDTDTGAVVWQTMLDLEVVNATPAVTTDLAGRNRVFITDYDPMFGAGSLYCINLDPFDALANPFQPGEIVWAVIAGATSGSTPAYDNGVVYLATAGLGGGAGQILAFDATVDSPSAPLWTVTNSKPAGFYGGVTVCDFSGSPAVYAASYAFFGGQRAANLIKVDAATGAVVWSIDANRTDAIPVILPDGRIVLSGGVMGFGAVPSVELFHDHGATVEFLWDSALSTWIDANGNGVLDEGEYLNVGGWTHQPIVLDPGVSGGFEVLYAGAEGNGFAPFGTNDQLLAIDLGPAASGGPIVLDQFTGAGSSPAIVGGLLMTAGPSGLVAFGNQSPAFDVNQDGTVDIDDLYDWYAGIGALDVNRDGVVDPADGALLEAELRKDELTTMIGGRR